MIDGRKPGIQFLPQRMLGFARLSRTNTKHSLR